MAARGARAPARASAAVTAERAVGGRITAMTLPTIRAVDLRRAPLVALRAVDFRAPERDFWADESEIWDRFEAVWAGLDEAAWVLPGAAPSDAGGPDWSLADHVAHVVDWLELAGGYVPEILAGAPWPADDDYGGGDFDRFNEARRPLFAAVSPAELRRRGRAARRELLPLARRLSMETIRSDDGWGWVYNVLHGHVADHLTVLEPWADELRRRQAEGEPFTADPRPAGDGSPAAIEAFWAAEADIAAMFDELVRPVPADRWEERGPTPQWTLKDHVAHLARWFEECADVVDAHLARGGWADGPAEGIDAWNARERVAAQSWTVDEAVRRFDVGRARLVRAVRAMDPGDLASPEAGEWVYECLHGHVREHLAMVGAWCARVGWPAAESRGSD
jgi:hypothetical protein